MTLALEKIRKLEAYKPPLEQREKFKGLRLDFNERLAPLPTKVAQAIQGFNPERSLSYPSYGKLCAKIAQYAGVNADQAMITNGSDQGIELIFRTFIADDDQVVIPSPSFAMFYQAAATSGATIIKPNYNKDGSFPFEQVILMSPKLLIICNPNNPTGTLLSLDKIEQILKQMPQTIVYVDEAYFEFSGLTAVKLIKKYQNLIITRTFSKAFGLASLRIGYTISCQSNINEMLKVRGPYDVNQVAKVAAEAALTCDVQDYCDEVMLKAKPLAEDFLRKNKIKFYPSKANFIYFKQPYDTFSKQLESNGILIRAQQNGYARVTIGTTKQMNQFIETFSKLIQ